jgi:hypothetical protein
MSTWRVLDLGDVSVSAPVFQYDCPGCGNTADLPVRGRPTAELSDGALIFDPGPRALPKTIQCRICERVFERGDP